MKAIIRFLLLTFLWATTSCICNQQLVEVTGFGTNPGNLKCYKYVPDNIAPNAPLVVALHGCSQSPQNMAMVTGWNKLADKAGFIVLYPAQQLSNNQLGCFDWFKREDITKNQGEASSIQQMVAYAKANHSINPGRVFVTGVSAGGGMTAVMMATYPELFAGGASIAGLPYASALPSEAYQPVLNGQVDKTPDQWKELVRNQNPNYTGPYPGIVIIHGTADAWANFKNAGELTEQWTAGHQASTANSQNFDPGNNQIVVTAYQNPSGKVVVVKYEIQNFGHFIPVDPGNGPRQGGRAVLFGKDIDFYSTYWIARFWGLVN